MAGETNGSDAYEVAKAVAILTGYHCRWASGMDQYEVLGVEEEFRAPLINPDTNAASRTWTLGGKLDVRVRDLFDGRTIVFDHKTAKGDVGVGSDYVKRLRLDGQISVYYAGAATLGPPVDLFVYDVLVKPGQRPTQIPLVDDDGVKIVLGPDGQRVKTKDGKKFRETGDAAQGFVLQTRPETPDEYRDRLIALIAAAPNDYFTRAEVVRLEAEMRDAMADVWQLGKSLLENANAKRFPRNPDACVRYGSTCSFFPACTGEASLDDAMLYRRSDVVHSELTNAGAEVLSASRLSCARACQRLHKLKYLDGYRPAHEAEALRFGSLIHLGLQKWWEAKPGEDRLQAALQAVVPATPEAVDAAGA